MAGRVSSGLRALWAQATSKANGGGSASGGGVADVADAADGSSCVSGSRSTTGSLQPTCLWLAPPSKARRLLRAGANPVCTSLEGPSEAAVAATLMQCDGCHAVWYCGPGCQQAHWKSGHKAACCGSRTAQVAAAAGGS